MVWEQLLFVLAVFLVVIKQLERRRFFLAIRRFKIVEPFWVVKWIQI